MTSPVWDELMEVDRRIALRMKSENACRPNSYDRGTLWAQCVLCTQNEEVFEHILQQFREFESETFGRDHQDDRGVRSDGH